MNGLALKDFETSNVDDGLYFSSEIQDAWT